MNSDRAASFLVALVLAVWLNDVTPFHVSSFSSRSSSTHPVGTTFHTPRLANTGKLHRQRNGQASASVLYMNWFENALGKAFQNEKFAKEEDTAKASARHILVKDYDQATSLLEQLQEAPDKFSQLAREFSTCPSGSSGGSLGSFSPGTMVKAFDEVIFNAETPLNSVVGPVETKFGYHLIIVEKRTGV